MDDIQNVIIYKYDKKMAPDKKSEATISWSMYLLQEVEGNRKACHHDGNHAHELDKDVE